MSGDGTPRLAAIHAPSSAAVDAVLDDVVGCLRRDGVRLGGLRQCAAAREGRGRIVVERLADGARHDLTRPRGRLARGCLLDEAALVALLPSLVAEIERGEPELFLLNRFGVREAEGRGACSLIEAALLADLPLLTVVRDAHVARWRDYGAEHVTTLACTSAAVLDWCATVVADRRVSRSRDAA